MNSTTMPPFTSVGNPVLDGADAQDQEIASLIAETGNGLLHASQITVMLCAGLKSFQAALAPQVAAILQSFDVLRLDVAMIGDLQAHDPQGRIERFMRELLSPPVEGAQLRHGNLLAQCRAIQAITRKETGETDRRQTFQALISALNGTADQLNELVGQYRSGHVAGEDGQQSQRIELCEIIQGHMQNHARSAEAAMAQYEASLDVVDRLTSGIDALFIRLDMLLSEMNDVATDYRVSNPVDLEPIGDSALALSVAIEQFQASGRDSSADLNAGLTDLIRSLSLDAERSRCQYQELQGRITTLGSGVQA